MPIVQCPCCHSNRRCVKFAKSVKAGNGRSGWSRSSQESNRDRWSAQPCASSRSQSSPYTTEIPSRTSCLRNAPRSPEQKQRPWDGRNPQGPWHPPLRSLTHRLYQFNLSATCSASLFPPNVHLRSLARRWRDRQSRARSAPYRARCRNNTLRTRPPLSLSLRLKLRQLCLIHPSRRKLAASFPYLMMMLLLRLPQPLSGSTMLHLCPEPRQRPLRRPRCLPVLRSRRLLLRRHHSVGTPKPLGIHTGATHHRPLRLQFHH